MSLPALDGSVAAQGYGQGTALDATHCPIGAKEFQQQYSAMDAYALTNNSKQILLTFDQGYENGFTEKILDVLAEKQVTALFFLTGDYATKETALIERMLADGHALGNHGMKHRKASQLSADALSEEITSLHDFVQEQYGYTMQYYRPPCGDYSDAALQTVQVLGYHTVFWSYAYVDWKTDAQPEPEFAFRALTEAAHGGGIYLLHSVSQTNAEVLGAVIDTLRAEGYQL